MSEQNALILVVDDNEMNRDMLSRRLKRMKYEALVAENGEQALEMVTQHPFNLVLLDIMMPKISGYDVLERLKNDEATKHIPIIMISAVDDLDSVVRCIELGAEDYLFKPFNPVLLKARVGASLRKNRMTTDSILPIVQKIQDAVNTLNDSDLSDDQLDAIKDIQQQLNILDTTIENTD
ncbi:MAG: response regulator [Chloroflexota bacterium]